MTEKISQIKIYSIPYDPVVEEIFYKHATEQRYHLEKNGNNVWSGEISSRLRNAISHNTQTGATRYPSLTFVPYHMDKLKPRNRIFGVKVHIGREVGLKNKTLSYAVTIKGYSDVDMVSKGSRFVHGLQKLLPNIQITEQTKGKFMECGE